MNKRTRILCGIVVFTTAGLLSSLPEGCARDRKARESLSAPAVVNATSSDATAGMDGADPAGPQQDFRSLRKKLTTLEAEIAVLKQRGQTP